MASIETSPPVVFVSYSHDSEEHRAWVLQLATRLRSNGVDVLLDRWDLRLGSDLASFMERGLSRSQRVLSVCSANYVKKANAGSGGVGYEKQILTAELMLNPNTDWVIPLVRNNPDIRKTPTFLGSRVYISFEDDNLYEARYEDLLRDIHEVPILPIPPIGPNPFEVIRALANQTFLPANERYHAPSFRGKVAFDYSNNNGLYSIGLDKMLFVLDWSKSGDGSIYLLNDPPSIRTIALVKDRNQIEHIEDARKYDGTSRHRTIHNGQIGVLQNANGFWAAVKVISVVDDSRGHDRDEIVFEYVIQTNGSPDFRH